MQIKSIFKLKQEKNLGIQMSVYSKIKLNFVHKRNDIKINQIRVGSENLFSRKHVVSGTV